MDAIGNLLAEHAVVKVVIAYMNAVDTGRWEDLAQYFADEVHLDYSDVHPNPAESLRREAVIRRWRNRFDGEIAYQHELSNLEVRVAGSDAVCNGNNVGSHVLEDASGQVVLWQVGVRLEWQLRLDRHGRWVISSVKAEYIWDRTEPFNGRKLAKRGKQ